MLLNFLGTGSAFNSKEGCNSAYFIKDDIFYLIDCGTDVCDKIKDKFDWKQFKRIVISVTHLHPDHYGSLGNFIFYLFYIHNIKPLLFFKDKDYIMDNLSGQGCPSSLYIIEEDYILEKNVAIIGVPVNHSNYLKSSYALVIKIDDKNIYYSGDVNAPFNNESEYSRFDEIYHECCTCDYPNNPHTHINKLIKRVPKEIQSKLFLMHVDNRDLLEEMIKDTDFGIVTAKEL